MPCLDLGALTAARYVDHRIPLAQGGTDDLANLQSICKTCHDRKTAGESSAGRRNNALAASPAVQSSAPARVAIAQPAPPQAPARPTPAGEQPRGWGGPIAGTRAPETDSVPKYLRAQVSGEGGVKPALVEYAAVPAGKSAVVD